MSNRDFIPYARQSINASDIAEVGRALASDVITRGPQVEAFEKALSQYCGAQHTVLFNSGTTALQAACHAARVNAQDRLITTPNTFVATAVAGIREGAAPVFVDIDPVTGNLDLDKLAPNLQVPTSRGRAIVLPVHYGGVPVAMKQLEAQIYYEETVVIEDAAAALGSSYDADHKVGCCRWSQMTVFSFHPAKLITTGEGGAVTTNDPELAHRLKRFRNNGIERDVPYLMEQGGPWYYEVQEITGNYNFTDFQAALGLSQLQRVDQMISKRQQVADWYRERLSNIPHLNLLCAQPNPHVSWQLMVALIDYPACKVCRSDVINGLKQEGIGTTVHYLPTYRHPYFKGRFGDVSEYFTGMEKFYAEALTLPLYDRLGESDVDKICQCLKALLLK